MNKILFIIVRSTLDYIMLLLAIIWGYYQIILFPTDKYGILFIFTAALGGYIIGSIFSSLDNYLDNK